MASTRRVGSESSETRVAILDAAEAVICEEGHAAASTRRVAARAGVRPSLVHYYFPTTDDLFLALFRRGAAQSEALVDAALAGDDPVRALWRFFADASRTTLSIEFIAIANHRPLIRAEIAAHSEAMRARQAAAIARAARPGAPPPAALALILAGIGRALIMEGGLGIAAGHDEAREWVDGWLGSNTRPA